MFLKGNPLTFKEKFQDFCPQILESKDTPGKRVFCYKEDIQFQVMLEFITSENNRNMSLLFFVPVVKINVLKVLVKILIVRFFYINK